MAVEQWRNPGSAENQEAQSQEKVTGAEREAKTEVLELDLGAKTQELRERIQEAERGLREIGPERTRLEGRFLDNLTAAFQKVVGEGAKYGHALRPPSREQLAIAPEIRGGQVSDAVSLDLMPLIFRVHEAAMAAQKDYTPTEQLRTGTEQYSQRIKEKEAYGAELIGEQVMQELARDGNDLDTMDLRISRLEYQSRLAERQVAILKEISEQGFDAFVRKQAQKELR